MTNRRYVAGRAYEYRVKKRLEEEGWTVLRMAGSHGEFDLVAVWEKWPTQHDCPPHRFIKLIQCKSGKSSKRAIKAVEQSDIKRWEGLYSVSVEIV